MRLTILKVEFGSLFREQKTVAIFISEYAQNVKQLRIIIYELPTGHFHCSVRRSLV